jgi:serine/threonine protein kinase
MFCPQCNISNTGDSRFCKNCGATLSGPISSSDVQAQSGIKTDALFPEVKKSDRLIGQIIDKRYQLESLIAVGGMGAVYRAKRLSIGDEVAVKILHDFFSGDQAASDRFQREAQMAARLKHPNAVNIYDFGTTDEDLRYLVMELVEGQSLREIIDKQGVLPFSAVADITTQVCAALDEAHRCGIIHRDIKPDNIIVHNTLNGLRVKVLDFGIAKLRDNTAATNLTQTGSIMGTPHYMSPEQCLGEELDQRSDIYSIGIVIYQMLCGRLPFNAPVTTAVVVQHVNQAPPSLREFNQSVPVSVESVVFHALEKQPNARPATAGLLAHELNSAFSAAGQQLNYPSGGHPYSTSVPSNPAVNNFAKGKFTPSSQETQPQQVSNTGDMPTVQLSSPVLQKYSPTSATDISALNSGAFHNRKSTGKPIKNKTKLIFICLAAFLILPLLIGGILFIRSKESGNQESGAKTTEQKSGQTTEQKSENKPAPPEGMVFVPGGEFTMGRDDGKLEDEKPAHKVSVNQFFMDVYEVSNEQYAEFITATKRKPPSEWKNGNYPNGQSRFPVVGVNWQDASDFCKNAGKRLPTEEEWEFAARGANNFLYPWGNDWKPSQANIGTQTFAEVGKFKGASPFGIYDMIGNAGEWTASDFKAYPNGKLSNVYAGKTNLKTIRGGSFEMLKDFASATYRIGLQPIDARMYDRTGFRCVQDIEK